MYLITKNYFFKLFDYNIGKEFNYYFDTILTLDPQVHSYSKPVFLKNAHKIEPYPKVSQFTTLSSSYLINIYDGNISLLVT